MLMVTLVPNATNPTVRTSWRRPHAKTLNAMSAIRLDVMNKLCAVRAATCIKTHARRLRVHEQRFSNDATTLCSLLYWNDALFDRTEYRAFVAIVHLDAHSIAPFEERRAGRVVAQCLDRAQFGEARIAHAAFADG